MAEIQNCSSEPEPTAINEWEGQASMKSTTQSSEASDTTSSRKENKGKGKAAAFKRRNPRVLVRRHRANNVDTIGLPLGMSFAAVMAQVFGDKLDGLTRNFEQSFCSTLSTLQLIYESSKSNEGNKLNNTKMEIMSSKLTLNKEECSGDIVTEVGHSRHAEIQDQSISHDSPEEVRDNFHIDSIGRDSPEEGRDNIHNNSVSLDSPEESRDNFHMGSVSRDLTLYGQSNQMVSFSQISFGSVNNPMVSIFEKSIMEQCRSNDLKTLELGLKMKELKLKEDELALNLDSNNLNRSKLVMGESKQSFKEEKFKTQLEDTRHGELKKKCIDCLITGLLIMSSSLLYGAYVYSYERITKATESCTPSTQARIFLLVDSQVNGLIQFKVAYFVVSSSSYEPNGIWHLDDFCCCIFALAAVDHNITDYASHFHPFNVGNFLWLLWQAMCRDIGWEWYCVALILGDYVLAAFLISLLDIRFVPDPSWTSHSITNNGGEYNSSVLDSQNGWNTVRSHLSTIPLRMQQHYRGKTTLSTTPLRFLQRVAPIVPVASIITR
ncbi:hypothetical protein JHK85_015675 [Glycine max]|nr:hypothetical protein JHK85_015675 [Glycine max]